MMQMPAEDPTGARYRAECAVALEPRIKHDQEIVAIEFEAVAGEIDNRGGVRAAGFDLGQELAKAAGKVSLIEIGAFDNVEANAAQCFGNETGIIHGGR